MINYQVSVTIRGSIKPTKSMLIQAVDVEAAWVRTQSIVGRIATDLGAPEPQFSASICAPVTADITRKQNFTWSHTS